MPHILHSEENQHNHIMFLKTRLLPKKRKKNSQLFHNILNFTPCTSWVGQRGITLHACAHKTHGLAANDRSSRKRNLAALTRPPPTPSDPLPLHLCRENVAINNDTDILLPFQRGTPVYRNTLVTFTISYEFYNTEWKYVSKSGQVRFLLRKGVWLFKYPFLDVYCARTRTDWII